MPNPYNRLIRRWQLTTKINTGKGLYIVPRLLVWFVLILTLPRDKNYPQVLNWLVSGFRWLGEHFPEQAQLVSEGALSHARKRMGPEVFATLLQLQIAAGPAGARFSLL